jgi:alpha-tubulin suppressor-like RCC1 family protein
MATFKVISTGIFGSITFFFLTGCGGGGTAATGQTDTCSMLCVSSLKADNVALLKGDKLSLSAVLQGSLKDSAIYSWDMGDGTQPKTTATVSNYSYDAVATNADNMQRITLTVSAKDTQGNTYTDSRQMQVSVTQVQSLISSGNTSGQFVMALDTTGIPRVSTDSYSTALGLTSKTYTQGELANLTASNTFRNGGGSFRARSLYGCVFDEICTQTFAVTQNNELLATGDDVGDGTGKRSTGVSGVADGWGYALDSSGQKLQNIRHVQSRMAALGTSSYALRLDGAVFAAGNNDSGRLGIGSNSDRSETFAAMRDGQGPVNNAVQVAASSAKVYVLRSDGSLWAAGSNNPGASGSLGIASSDTSDRTQLVATYDNTGKPLTNVRQIYTDSDGSTFAVRWDGSLWVAGYNTFGQLGLNTTSLGDPEQGFRPALRNDGSPMTNVSWVSPNRAAYSHQTFVRTTDGALWFAGERAKSYAVAAADINADGQALRFAPVRNQLTGAALSNVAAAEFSKGVYTFAMLTDGNGNLAAMGVVGNTGMAYAVANSVNTTDNLALTGQIMPVRFANWKGANGWNNTRSVIYSSVADQQDQRGNALWTLTLTDTGNNTTPTICKFNTSDTVLAAVGCDGQLYLAAGRANHYAVSSALVPMFPQTGALRFVTGKE